MIAVREMGIYAVGAAVAFVVDVALLTAQVEWLGINYLVAATFSFIAGTVVVYRVSVEHAFAYRRIDRAHVEFGIFAVVGGVGVLVNLAAMYLAVQSLHLHYLLAKCLAAGFTFLTNFATRRALLFTRYTRKSTTPLGNDE